LLAVPHGGEMKTKIMRPASAEIICNKGWGHVPTSNPNHDISPTSPAFALVHCQASDASCSDCLGQPRRASANFHNK
jgi:hypothetical protein